jgi:hypothetical protein
MAPGAPVSGGNSMRSIIMAAALGLIATPAMAVSTKIYVSGQNGIYVDSTAAGPQSGAGSTFDGDYVALADAGVLKSSVVFDLPTNLNGLYTSGGISSVVSFTDVLTVSAPGLTSGSFTASLLIDGLLDPRASSFQPSGNGGFPNFEIKVELPDLASTVFDFTYTLSNYNGFVSAGGGSLNGMRYSGPYTGAFDFSIPFDSLVGQTVKVSLTCAVFAFTVRAGDTAGGTCDFAHTVTWGGVSQVLDQNGDPVSGVNITGATGANYAQSFVSGVPEPASWAMMLAGFGLAGVMLRRQRRALPA